MNNLTNLLLLCCAAGSFAGAPGSIFNPYKSTANDLTRRRRACVVGVDYGPGTGKKPEDVGCTSGGGGGTKPEGGGGGGGGGGAESGTTVSGGGSSPRSSSPHATSMLGNVGVATVAVSEADKESGKFEKAANAGTGGIGEDIFGPFEAGFGAQQDNILKAFGCSDPSKGYIDGGADTGMFQDVLTHGCDIVLPRWEGEEYISILDQCGGHTKDYHFHESLICLYDDAASGHSTKVGEAVDGKPIYGKYEDTNELPLLDACSAHYGNTPDSTDATIYHYHVQDAAPFVVGCFGPNEDASLVTVAQCRDFYTGCGDGDEQTFTTAAGTFEYDMWCPCFDKSGSNFGTIDELEVFSAAGAILKGDDTQKFTVADDTAAPTSAPTGGATGITVQPAVTAVTTKTTAALKIGATSIALADVSQITAGDKLTVGSGADAEIAEVASVKVDAGTRSRRAATPGTVTLTKGLEKAHVEGIAITWTSNVTVQAAGATATTAMVVAVFGVMVAAMF